MRLKHLTTVLAMAVSATMLAAPAQADIYEYEMTNGDLLTINTDTQSGSWKGKNIDASFTSPDFAHFTGGENPKFKAILTSLDGTRIVNGHVLTDNPKNIDTTHPQVLKGLGDRINLWAWWGDPIKAGDYIKHVGGLTVTPTSVPEPGMLGLFALALGMIGFGSYRRRTKLTAA